MDLSSLIDEARETGWAEGTATLVEVRHEALWLGMAEVPNRSGGPPVTKLQPLTAERAQPNSLSARYGMGDQPLHTDGAHLPQPPDVIVLACERTSQVPTRLWSLSDFRSNRGEVSLVHGVFLVSSGRESFFCTALDSRGLRFDPGCMIPCDARARRLAKYFADTVEDAVAFEWDKPGKILVIDNRRVLHGRASAEPEPGRELERVCLNLEGAHQ